MAHGSTGSRACAPGAQARLSYPACVSLVPCDIAGELVAAANREHSASTCQQLVQNKTIKGSHRERPGSLGADAFAGAVLRCSRDANDKHAEGELAYGRAEV